MITIVLVVVLIIANVALTSWARRADRDRLDALGAASAYLRELHSHAPAKAEALRREHQPYPFEGLGIPRRPGRRPRRPGCDIESA